MQTIMTHFELLLTLAVILCLIFYIIDLKSYRKTRNRLYKIFKAHKETDSERNEYAERLVFAQEKGIKHKQRALFESANQKINNRKPLEKSELYWIKHPIYPKEKFIEFFSGMFWILCIIWFVRSFLWEPFQIPSASMEPTLQNGDFILTSKYSYGVRLPVLHKTIIPTGEVKRGDVIVFRYPPQPEINYIKRVVGLPGDQFMFEDGRITINNVEVPIQAINTRYGFDRGERRYQVYREQLPNKSHLIQFDYDPRARMNTRRMPQGESSFTDGKTFTIPEGHYFVMGDNRDDSLDSRYFGLVPEENLVGKALFIWLNSSCIFGKGHCNRIFNKID